MAYRYGEPQQNMLFPQSIEEYVPADDPVRIYSEFVDALDLNQLGIKINENKIGNSAYHPRLMLKLLVYAYSYGWRSSRKIERAIQHNISFIWLMNGLKPDHKTIAKFRRDNKHVLHNVLRQCARLCVSLDLIEGSTLFVDGTKIRACASRNKNYTKDAYDKLLVKINNRISEILTECEEIDQQEKGHPSLVKLKKELSSKEQRKEKITRILKQFGQDSSATTINETDSDSRIMKSVQGSHASYNMQSTVDAKHGMIVSVDATNAPTDFGQLSTQVAYAEETLSQASSTVCADAGYYAVADLATLDKNKTIIVPNGEQAAEKEPGEFHKSKFHYNEETDFYTCPEGHKLYRSTYNKTKNQYQYRMKSAKICAQCIHYGKCTTAKRGRNIFRLKNEKIHQNIMRTYELPENKALYQKRKAVVEHPFGHIKRNLGLTQFLMRGKSSAQAEMSLVATSFNIARLITIAGGVIPAIQLLKGLLC